LYKHRLFMRKRMFSLNINLVFQVRNKLNLMCWMWCSGDIWRYYSLRQKNMIKSDPDTQFNLADVWLCQCLVWSLELTIIWSGSDLQVSNTATMISESLISNCQFKEDCRLNSQMTEYLNHDQHVKLATCQ